MKNYIQSIKIIILGSIIAGGFGLASAWVVPATTPPGGNVPAPINVSGNAQYKVGGLAIGEGVSVAPLVNNSASLVVGGLSAAQSFVAQANAIAADHYTVGPNSAIYADIGSGGFDIEASVAGNDSLLLSSNLDQAHNPGATYPARLCADGQGGIVLCPDNQVQ